VCLKDCYALKFKILGAMIKKKIIKRFIIQINILLSFLFIIESKKIPVSIKYKSVRLFSTLIAIINVS